MTCPYDPTKVPGCVSMHHCPICGEMVIAGMPHLDYGADELDCNNRSDADLFQHLEEIKDDFNQNKNPQG